MALVGSKQLWVQDPAPVRRCGTEGRAGHQGREGGNGGESENGNGTIIERRVGGRESPRIEEAGRKTWEKGRRQRVTRGYSRKTRHLSETVASCGGPESNDGRGST